VLNKNTGILQKRKSVDYWVFGILKYSERICQPESGMPEKVKELEYESIHNA
jgi:hypothetical protein